MASEQEHHFQIKPDRPAQCQAEIIRLFHAQPNCFAHLIFLDHLVKRRRKFREMLYHLLLESAKSPLAHRLDLLFANN
jgi:hypothetical protein